MGPFVLGSIGVLLAIAQPAPAQERNPGANGGVGALRDERFRDQFERLLLAAATRDYEQGWQLALDLGRPAVPMLRQMLQREKANVGPRLVLLAATVLAGGTGEDEALFAWLDPQAPMLEERVLLALLLAMGPRRTRPMEDFWPRLLGGARSTPAILAVAARLAAARFPGSETGAPVLIDEDPGVAAATAFAGLSVRASIANRLWNLRTPERHADLFWRGGLLGGARRGDVESAPQALLQERAREVMALPSDQFAAARGAAALFRVRVRDVRMEGERPDWRMLQLLASDGPAATALAGWLGAVPKPLDDEPQRLAVAYVLGRAPETVIAERALWAADARVRRHIAIALAYRLLGESMEPRLESVPLGVPEWFFVRWALHQRGGLEGVEGKLEDPILAAAAGLAVEGRLPRPVARAMLEETLWRWGSHPGLGQFDAERLLVRDLLLLGSRQGGKYPHRPTEQLYRPAGIDKDHLFFDIAVPLWDFLSRPRLPMPAEYRLR